MLIPNFLRFLALIIQELVYETKKIENQPKLKNINLIVIWPVTYALTYVINSKNSVNVPDKDEVLRGWAKEKWPGFLSKASCTNHLAMSW